MGIERRGENGVKEKVKEDGVKRTKGGEKVLTLLEASFLFFLLVREGGGSMDTGGASVLGNSSDRDRCNVDDKESDVPSHLAKLTVKG